MSELVKLITGVAWPALIAFGFWFFRVQIKAGSDLLLRQLSAGAAVKWKDFEFTGVSLRDFGKGGDASYKKTPALTSDLQARDEKYAEQKNLFLVHQVLATGKLHPDLNLPVFEILVRLTSHKHYGRLNDVKRVEYYFGKYFDRYNYEFGAKYLVENGSDGFAVKVDAYGPTLCEAKIFFHDGQVTSCSRYMDFGGTHYAYDPVVADYDAKANRQLETQT